jgi:PAS domain S-box-containing protein
VNDAIALRIKTLESLALLLQHGSAGQGVAQVLGQLERYPLTQDLFNEGLIVVDAQGRIQAEAPLRAHRVGRDVADTDYFKRAMQGTPHVGAPLVDPQFQHPFVVLAVPVRDSQGRVGGVLGGIINLQQPNFLNRLTERRFGLTGHTFVITPQNRTIVATSDKSRFMEVLPAPGVNPWIDLFMAGYEGSAVVTNPHGLEVLVTIKQVPIAGWYTSVILSTEEAFAPVNDARRRLLTVYLPLFVLLTSGLIWWVLRRQLAPLMDTTRTLTRLALSDTPVMPLPIQRVDEVGALIGGFNHLLQTLAQRQTALNETEARFKVLADNAPALVWMTGVDGQLNYFNKVWLDFTGRNLEQEVGGEWVQAIHPDDALHANQVYRLAYRAREPFHVDYRLRRGDGQYRWMAFNGVPRNDAQGVFAGFIGSGIDITERKLAEVRMQLMASVFTHAGEGILITDVEGTVVDVNDGFTRITGYTLADMQGQTTRLLQSGRHDPPFFQALWHTLQAQGQWRGEVWNRRKNGEVFPDLVTISNVKDTDGSVTHYVAFYSDITALKEHEAQLEKVAHFDSLTGLPNRLMLADRLKQVMPHTVRRSQRLAVVFGRHGARHPIALRQRAAQQQQGSTMLQRFNAFGNHRAVEGLGQAHHAVHNAQVVRVVQHVAHKALVDLDQVNRQVAEVRQRRVAGAKVVQRKPHPQRPATGHHLRCTVEVADGGGFQNFQFQLLRRHVGVAGQCAGQHGHKALRQQVVGADVDTHFQPRALVQPGRQLRQGSLNHPFAQRKVKRLPGDQLQKLARCAQAQFGVLPAQQCLGTHHHPGAQIDLGLVVQQQLVLCERLFQPLQLFAVHLHLFVVFRVEQVVAVLALLLGGVHGLVGMTQQGVGVGIVMRVQREANAGRHLHLGIANGHGLGNAAQHALQHAVAFLGVAQVGQQQHKLVAAQAGQGVVFAQHCLQAAGNFNQQLVAHVVAMQVVHFFEAVQVEHAHGQGELVAPCAGQGHFHAVTQQAAVGHARQHVVLGNVGQLGLVGLQPRDVAEHGQVVRQLAIVALHGGDGQDFGIQLAGFAPVPDRCVHR